MPPLVPTRSLAHALAFETLATSEVLNAGTRREVAQSHGSPACVYAIQHRSATPSRHYAPNDFQVRRTSTLIFDARVNRAAARYDQARNC